MATVCQNDHSKYVFHGRLRSEIRLFHTEQRGPNSPCSIVTAECLSLYVLTGYQGAKNERGDGRVVWSLQPNGSIRQLLQWNILGCHFFGLIVGFPPPPDEKSKMHVTQRDCMRETCFEIWAVVHTTSNVYVFTADELLLFIKMKHTCSPQHDPLTYDYVLVANNLGDSNSETFRKQVAFVNALKEKKLKIIVSCDLIELKDMRRN